MCCDGRCQCMKSNTTGQLFTGTLCTCSPDNHTCIDPQAPLVSSNIVFVMYVCACVTRTVNESIVFRAACECM